MAGIMTGIDASGWRERAIAFGRHRGLFGIVTEPSTPRGLPVVILGAGILHRIGPSRTSVELARSLAGLGHPTVRFDLSSIGDSSRAPEADLSDAVQADISDAIALVDAGDGVILVGYCSGADNAFFIAADDERVRAAVLFDPTVHRTAGFHDRERRRRLTSPDAWRNVLSGRSIRARLPRRSGATQVRPPEFFGLLVAGPEDTDNRAGRLRDRRVPLLYVLSSGIRNYCNAPEQVRESMPSGFDPELFEVSWAPHLDHVLSSIDQRSWFIDRIGDWIAPFRSAAPQPSLSSEIA